jgi:hypothetical protein
MSRLQIENELMEVNQIQLPTLQNSGLEQGRVCKQAVGDSGPHQNESLREVKRKKS